MNTKPKPEDRVEFLGKQGKQKGKIEAIVPASATAPEYAIIAVDHALPGILETVHLTKLSVLPDTKKAAA